MRQLSIKQINDQASPMPITSYHTGTKKRRVEKEFWAYDTTTLSSYSETLQQVQFGFNKENDKLPQLNVALVFQYLLNSQSNLFISYSPSLWGFYAELFLKGCL